MFGEQNFSLSINSNLRLYNEKNDFSNNKIFGRDKDPKLKTDISSSQLLFRKVLWTTLTSPGIRNMTKLMFPSSTISYIKTKKKVVAFSIDDGFCGYDNPNGSMVNEVRELFSRYDAKATFFVTGSHCNYSLVADIKKIINDGHEIANHSMYDFPYDKYTEEEFLIDLEQTNTILSKYTNNVPKLYRAPHAKLSKKMQNVLNNKGYTHVISDAFANDTAIPDPIWISNFIINRTNTGSIILIHMPEKGVREWNYKAIELTLKGLTDYGYTILTISDLFKNRN